MGEWVVRVKSARLVREDALCCRVVGWACANGGRGSAKAVCAC